MKRWIPWTVAAVVVVLVGAGTLRALGARKAQQQALATAAAPEVVMQIASNELWVARRQSLPLTVPLTGTVRAVQTAFIKARVPGEVQGLTLREGDSVRSGQEVARIDPTELDLAERQAQQQADAAKAQVAINERQYTNNRALVEQGFISATALDTTASNLAAAEANHRAALATLDIARKGLADTTLRSPLTGQIASRLVQNGERVGVDARLMDVVDLSAFELEAALAPAAAAAVQPGQKATLTVEGLTQPVAATVSRINPSVQAGSRSVLVYLRVPAVAGMRQGLFAQGQIVTGSLQAAALPLSAVRNDKPAPYVQVLANEQVAHVAVPLTRQATHAGEAMLVVDGVAGLAEGTPVLRATAGALREGTAVKAAPAPAAAAKP